MFLIQEDFFEIKETKEKGRGAFAKKEIPAGIVIGDYLGKLISVDNEEEENLEEIYAMEINDEILVDPDVNSVGIHLINHSCTPNSAMIPFHEHMLYFALRKIFVGEELTVSYLIEQDHEGHHHFCFCESPFCHGTMYISESYNEQVGDFFDKIRREDDIKITTPLGEYLPPLEKYPTSIEDFEIYDLFGNFEEVPETNEDAAPPNISTLRKTIRESGKRIYFPKIKFTVYGVTRGGLIVGK